jgi:hypothetical protein
MVRKEREREEREREREREEREREREMSKAYRGQRDIRQQRLSGFRV